MTAQEIFDKVINHLLQQGAPALSYYYDDDPRCSYRADNGFKCAIGCLIPDDQYDPLMEGNGVNWSSADPLNKWVEQHYEPHRSLLADLQFLHDSAETSIDPGAWQAAILKGAAEIAEKFDLAMPRTQP